MTKSLYTNLKSFLSTLFWLGYSRERKERKSKKTNISRTNIVKRGCDIELGTNESFEDSVIYDVYAYVIFGGRCNIWKRELHPCIKGLAESFPPYHMLSETNKKQCQQTLFQSKNKNNFSISI